MRSFILDLTKLEALLLGGHTWQVVCIMVFQVLRFYYGSHLVMVGWVAVPGILLYRNQVRTTHLGSSRT